MRVLVTGGSGFIGTRLVSELLAHGFDVQIFDKVISKRFPDICSVGDVRDISELRKVLREKDIVFHLAAEHRDDVRPVSLYYDVNVEATRHLVAACQENDVQKIIFTSSVAIYGLDAGEPAEHWAPRPFNDYGRSKAEAEEILRQWERISTRHSLVIVRPSVIFGEGNRGNVYNLVRQIVTNRFVMVGHGRNMKSMGYVGNIAAFLAYCAIHSREGTTIYNYADKPDFSMNQLVQLVNDSTKKGRMFTVRIPYSIGIVGGFFFDAISLVTRLKLPISVVRIRKFCASTTVSVSRMEASGFVPPYSLATGMKLFLEHEFGTKAVDSEA